MTFAEVKRNFSKILEEELEIRQGVGAKIESKGEKIANSIDLAIK